MTFMNGDGLQTRVAKHVVIAKPASTVQSHGLAPHVRILLNVTAQGANRGGGAGNLETSFTFADAYGAYTPVGYEKLKTITDDKGFWAVTYIDYQLQYKWDAVTPITKMRLTCRSVNNYLYVSGSVIVNSITLQVFTSEGQEPQYVRVPIATAVNLNNPTDKIVIDKENRVGVACGRRGDVYEDEPWLMEITLDASKLPVMQSKTANIGTFKEVYSKEFAPGKYVNYEPTIVKTAALLSSNE